MTEHELKRLKEIEQFCTQEMTKMGLNLVEVDFQVVPAEQVISAMAYHFPTNFSHWTFGRDYDRYRTIYDHTGGGIPYEVVWNFERPVALLVETNPFALNATIIAHVFGHVDFFRSNVYLQHGRSFGDIATEARAAALRFQDYTEYEGAEELEKTIDAAMSIMWHQSLDPFHTHLDEKISRNEALAREKAKIAQETESRSISKQEIRERLTAISARTPLTSEPDLLRYIIDHSPKPLADWQLDALEIIYQQARALAPNRRTQMLNEGWSTYWHTKMMLIMKKTGLITPKEYETFLRYHAGVTAEHPGSIINPYLIGSELFKYIEDRWNRGQFGPEWEKCEDPHKRFNWQKDTGLGREKILDIRARYSDRRAVAEFFTDDFIGDNQLRVGKYQDPEIVKQFYLHRYTFYELPIVTIENGNFLDDRNLHLKHQYTGFELDQEYVRGTLENIFYLWGLTVHLEAIEVNDDQTEFRVVWHSYDDDLGHDRDEGAWKDIEKLDLI